MPDCRRSSCGAIRRSWPAERDRLLQTLLLFGLSLTFFGGGEMISLAAIAGLGHGVVAGSLAVGAGLAAWSLTGSTPPYSISGVDRFVDRVAG